MRLLVLLLLLGSGGWAQVSLTGSVRSAGHPIPGAQVTASLDGHSISTLTDEAGQYRLAGLKRGSWSFRVKMFGFSTITQEVLIDDQPKPVDWTLELKLEASSPARSSIQPSDVKVSAPDPNPDVLPSLPPLADDANATEAFLLSGSLSRGLQIQPTEGSSDTDSGSKKKSKRDQKSSGKSQPGIFGSGAGGGNDALQVKKVSRGLRKISNKSARASSIGNNNGGSLANIHGAAYWTTSDSGWNARPFSVTGQEMPRPDLGQNRVDLSVGGPVHIPALGGSEDPFFFVSYSRASSHTPYVGVSQMPSLQERSGDFSQSSVRGPVTVFDPMNGMPFPGDRVPRSRIDRIATGLMAFIPPANQSTPIQNYQIATSVPVDTQGVGIRLNHNPGSRNHVAFSFNRQERAVNNAQLYGFRDDVQGQGFTSDLSFTRSLRSNLVLKMRWSFRRSASDTTPFFAYTTDVSAALGIPGTSHNPVDYGPPNLAFSNFGKLSDASALLRRDQSSTAGADLTWVKGSHNVAFGGGFRRLQFNNRTDQNGRGSFTFTGLLTSAFDSNGLPLAGTGYDFADFLLGLPHSMSVRYGAANNYFRSSDGSAYVQDDWRIRPNLTFNFGLRYDYLGAFTEKYGRMANLDIAPAFTGVAVVTPGGQGPYSGLFPAALIDPDRNNFSPRLGVAWKPSRTSQTQIRLGYGWYYNPAIYEQIAPKLASQPPFATTAKQSTSLDHPLSIEEGFSAPSSMKIRNTWAVDRGYRTGYAQTWNLAVQRELPHAFVVEVGYLGTKGTRLDVVRLPNRAAPGSPLTAQDRQMIPTAVSFVFESSDGNSIYHAAQVRLARRFKRGISLNALYTFSRSIDDVSSFDGLSNVVAQDANDLRAERGLSSFDRRHVLILSYILTSPIGDRSTFISASGPLGRMLKNWTLEASLIAESGLPFTARLLGNRADAAGTGVVGSSRADSTGAPVLAPDGLFNTAAFAIPPLTQFGNAGRDTIPGPALVTQNLTFGRTFRLGERLRLRVRLDATNLTNRVSYVGLGTVVNAPDYGLTLAAAPMRTLSLATRLRF